MITEPPIELAKRFLDAADHRAAFDRARDDAQRFIFGGNLTTGCHGDHHEPRPWVGDPPMPRWFSCYCGAKTWRLEACPTCGHDRTVSA